ncbi:MULTISPECIES: YjiH family protein [Clostridium]|uniref:YjiH family protein n=1 Tax=Clostridium faecium TaxID=2762223 RepID=A0ABR8YXJ1_9CLOT|nr:MULTISPECIES: YjiH family protein [Clostridium]MBD8048656.1 YjiH family protein [Clostridium faecium]MDU1348015.1 YjiH family protein [Clostridium argentinense]
MINLKENPKTTLGVLKFIIPSLIGVILFMIPIPFNGEVTIPVALLSNSIIEILEENLTTITAVIISISTILAIVTKMLKPRFITENKYLNSLFNITPLWLFIRILGMIFVILSLFKVGPEWIWSDATGGMLLTSLLPVLFAVFLFAGMLLPLLLNFGLLEFFGTLLTKVMRPVFKLPGRSSIDCITSWLGDGTIGVLLTSKQYEEGYYTKREAAVIGTTFSAVSITFSLVVLQTVRLERYFVPYYLTICLAGVVAAIIIPRIPPLSRKEDSYYVEPKDAGELVPKGFTRTEWGFHQAIKRAGQNTSIKEFLLEGTKNVLDMWLGVIPIVMAIGTLALIIAEFTPVFKFLGMPFYPILKLLQVPEALAASQTLIVGFADMFLPSVIGSSIESELTRFVVAAISVTQLIYMSEVGGLLIGSKIPVSMKDLFIIFIERTLITLPVVVLVAHIIF